MMAIDFKDHATETTVSNAAKVEVEIIPPAKGICGDPTRLGLDVHEVLFLKSEGLVTPERVATRRALLDILRGVPDEYLAYWQILNLESGCRHMCALCSQEAGAAVTAFTKEGLEDALSALLTVATERRKRDSGRRHDGRPLVGYGFETYRPGLMKLYYDNDSAESPLLADAVQHLYENFGVKARLSMVGYSRRDHRLQSMHEAIVRNLSHMVDSVRFSFSSHPTGWRKDREEFLEDYANMLRTWKPFIDSRRGFGRYQGAITEFRMDPDVEVDECVLDDQVLLERHVVHLGPVVLVSRDRRVSPPQETTVVGANGRSAVFAQNAIPYVMLVSDDIFRGPSWREWVAALIRTELQEGRVETVLHGPCGRQCAARAGGLYCLRNRDGLFYAFEPTFQPNGTYQAANIYPKTELRRVSGIFEENRWCLNALLRVKRELGIERRSPFPKATWGHVDRFLEEVECSAAGVRPYNRRAASHAAEQVLPLLKAYIWVLRRAGFGPEYVFDPNFTYFAGPLYNMGRANGLFKGLATHADDPMTAAEMRESYLTYRFEPPTKLSPVPLVLPGETPTIRITGSKTRRSDTGLGAIVFEQLDRLDAMRPRRSIYIRGLVKLERRS